MTSRLKRKLEDIGVNVTSKKANENFCLIGTPLPPLEKSKDTGEFVPLWKQEVRDEKGRRRLHGAFTGGFSAGYFNTVGSKEGWAPSTFVSSRNERAKNAAARPEDFMDEEDLQDLKDSRTMVDTTDEMDLTLANQGTPLQNAESDELGKDPITSALQASLLPGPKDSIGAKILKKMGWRLGQGIGPRISLRRRKEQDAQAYDPISGTKMTSGSLNLPQDDEEADKHFYAPRDTPVLAVNRKDNTHGLGYVPNLTLQERLGNSSSGGTSGPRLAGGFGLGALNDADEDDLDVYEQVQAQPLRHGVAYDQIDIDGNDTTVIGSTKESKSRAVHSSTNHFRDGQPALAGFVISDEPVAQDKWFPLPEIPAGWKPSPKDIWAKDKENMQLPNTSAEPLPHSKWKHSHISADQRGVILGEIPLPSAPRSVFDYMSGKDKERIQRIAANLTSGQESTPSSGPGFTGPVPQGPSLTSRLEPHVAQAALRGFQPFTSDSAKQARYTAYLQSLADPGGSAPPLRPSLSQTPDEFTKELEDYAKAASLFKPMSGAMAGRFTSAAVLDMGPTIVEGLHQPSLAELEEKERKRKEEEQKANDKVDPKVHAASLGMYGPMTRETVPWVPNRLLCKRFGVNDPDVQLPSEMATATSSSMPSEELNDPSSVTDHNASTSALADLPTQRDEGPRDITNIGLGEDDTQGQDTLTYQRPSMDIFKAIFASDDEDEEDDTPDDDGTVAPEAVANNSNNEGFTSAATILEDKPFDPDNFKPTFTRREGKMKTKGDHGTEKSKEKKEKKGKKKKGVLVSFAMDEGGDEGELRQPKDRPPKKKRKKVDENDQTVMVNESPTQMAVVPSVDAAIAPSGSGTLNKGRKRAVDFMD